MTTETQIQMTGSEKQIAWAMQLRAHDLAEVERMQRVHNQQIWGAELDCYKAQTSAKWFIETRQVPIMSLLDTIESILAGKQGRMLLLKLQQWESWGFIH